MLNVNMNKMIKNVILEDLNGTVAIGFFKYKNFKDDSIHIYLCCNQDYQKKYWWTLKETAINTFIFSKNDIRTFIISLQKHVWHIGKHFFVMIL